MFLSLTTDQTVLEMVNSLMDMASLLVQTKIYISVISAIIVYRFWIETVALSAKLALELMEVLPDSWQALDIVSLQNGTVVVGDNSYLHFFEQDGTFIKRVNTSIARKYVSVSKDGSLFSYQRLRDRGMETKLLI